MKRWVEKITNILEKHEITFESNEHALPSGNFELTAEEIEKLFVTEIESLKEEIESLQSVVNQLVKVCRHLTM